MVSDSCKKTLWQNHDGGDGARRPRRNRSRIYSMVLKGEMVAQMLPGQFLHIRVPDGSKLLRRPISISEIDRKTQTCRLIYRIEGGGTAIFSQLPIGSKLSVMGPQEMVLISLISVKVRKPWSSVAVSVFLLWSKWPNNSMSKGWKLKWLSALRPKSRYFGRRAF